MHPVEFSYAGKNFPLRNRALLPGAEILKTRFQIACFDCLVSDVLESCVHRCVSVGVRVFQIASFQMC